MFLQEHYVYTTLYIQAPPCNRCYISCLPPPGNMPASHALADIRGTITLSTSCNVASRACCFTIQPSGGFPRSSAGSGSTAATTLSCPSRATRMSTLGLWLGWNNAAFRQLWLLLREGAS